jgi:uncharacterized lipoprotein YajG
MNMRYWMLASCLLLAGCGPAKPSNVLDTSDQKAMAEYEAALAEADKLTEQTKDSD